MQKLKIGIVGLNFGNAIIQNELINGTAGSRFELAAICDMNHTKLDQLAHQYQVKAYTDLDQLITDAEIDVIGLYTGPSGRANLIRRIIHAGKHVITTKPFELDPVAALEILHEAKQIGRIVHLNSPGPTYATDIQCIKDWQIEYKLGRCISTQWQVWSNYSEQADGSWYDDPTTCPAAPILRLGIYGINDILNFCKQPQTLHVMHSRFQTGRPTADAAQLTIRFAGGEMAHLFAGFCIADGAPHTRRMIMTFENGAVYMNAGGREDLATQDVRMELQTTGPDGTGSIIRRTIPAGSRSGQYQWDVLYKAVRGEAVEETTTPEMIVDGIRIIQAMAESDRTGQVVRLAGTAD